MKALFLCMFVLSFVYANMDAKDFHKTLSEKMKLAFRGKANLYRPDKNEAQKFRDLTEGKVPR